jgi:two-component system sensor histidine kinase KdpD
MSSAAAPPAPKPRGRLKIYLGYAAGVGKTYQMLEEAQEAKRDGRDVVIGYFEPHGRKDTIAKTEGLEIIPRRVVEYRGTLFEEMDTEAILRRNPQVCVVDEFPHTNVPGSERAKRWEDVLTLLDQGIDVMTTMNIQHIESLNDQVYQITGVRVRETIPDWIVSEADEVVMVDLTPRALLNRLERGVVYSHDKAKQALQNFFKESTLGALREIALRQTAHEVDVRQAEDQSPATEEIVTNDRILVLITSDPASAALIRRGRRVADYVHAECYAVCVLKQGEFERLPPEQRAAIEKYLSFARELHIETRRLEGENVAQTAVEFARAHQVTQIFLARTQRRSKLASLSRSLVHQIVRLAGDMQVTLVADRKFTKQD